MITMNKTKIIATIGPATANREALKSLIINGVDAFRINMTYSSLNFCEQIIDMINSLNTMLKTYVAVILDVKGPTIKVGRISNGKAFLRQDDKIRIFMDPVLGDCTKFSVDYPDLVNDAILNSIIEVDNGNVELHVLDKGDDYLLCKVLKEGTIEDNKTVNLPNIKLNRKFLSEQDKEVIRFANRKNVDFLALSYVSSSDDVLEVNDLLINLGNDHLQIISKIENNYALDDIDNIIKVSDGIIIDRKDLSVEVPLEKIPGIQKKIISKCHAKGAISIVATDLLSATHTNSYPTRAEVSDIAIPVLHGTDTIMLSDETTIGTNPIETLKLLEKIIHTAEEDIDYEYMLEQSIKTEKRDATGSLAYSVAGCALRLKCKAIFTPTMSGYTAKKISRFRPLCPIIAPSPNIDTTKSLALNFGVYPILIEDLKSLDAIIEKSKKIAQDVLLLKEKDNIIITGGYPFKKIKSTNFMKIEEI